jgi:putative zinc finger/helix-turn-helix YgiT family protein
MTFDRCLACGAVAVEERVEPFEVLHDGKSMTIQDRRMVCAECGNVSYRGAQASEHERAVGAAIREMDGLLSAEELYRIRAKYRLKQTDMEQILSMGPKTWTRWERGKVPQSKPADKLIRAMAEDPDLACRLMRGAGVVNSEAEATFEQIERDARRLARAMLRAELGERPSAELERLADRIVDTAFEKVGDARRKAASRVEAA